MDARFNHSPDFDMQVDTETHAYKRLMAVGFIIDNFEYGYNKLDYFFVRCDFTCICKRDEHFLDRTTDILTWQRYIKGNKFDVARRIEELGAISVDHLRKDGYSEEEIARIRAPYNPPKEHFYEQYR